MEKDLFCFNLNVNNDFTTTYDIKKDKDIFIQTNQHSY